jgi:hypothetical protein
LSRVNWRGESDTLRQFSRVSRKAEAALPQRGAALFGHSARCAPFASAGSFGDGCAPGAPSLRDGAKKSEYSSQRSDDCLSVAERRTPWSIEVVVDRFVKKRRDAPRIELACGDFGLRPRGICFPQSVLASQSHLQRNAPALGRFPSEQSHEFKRRA